MIAIEKLRRDIADRTAEQLRVIVVMLAKDCNTYEQNIADLKATLDKYRRAVRDLNDLLGEK